MKTTKILFWVFTGLLSLAIIFSSWGQVIVNKEAIDLFKQFQFPEYMIRFLGVAKILAIVAILYPGFPRLKEWAYAGLFFDLVGVLVCGFGTGATVVQMLPMLAFFVFLFGSYYFYHKLAKAKAIQSDLAAA